MIASGGIGRVFVATLPINFRKGHDGLALAVQEMFGLDPFCGAAFVFRSKIPTGSRSLPGARPASFWCTSGWRGQHCVAAGARWSDEDVAGASLCPV